MSNKIYKISWSSFINSHINNEYFFNFPLTWKLYYALIISNKTDIWPKMFPLLSDHNRSFLFLSLANENMLSTQILKNLKREKPEDHVKSTWKNTAQNKQLRTLITKAYFYQTNIKFKNPSLSLTNKQYPDL